MPPNNPNENKPDPHNLRWETLCTLDDVEPGRAKYIEFENHAYSVVRAKPQNPTTAGGDPPPIDQEVQIFDDACPHAGASMSYGSVKENCFICPVHLWAFSMTDGKNPDNPDIKLQTYPTRISPNNDIQIGIPKDIH